MSKIAIFENIRAVMKADKACKAEGFILDVVPVPEYLSSECGMCFVVSDTLIDSFTTLMEHHKLNIKLHEKR